MKKQNPEPPEDIRVKSTSAIWAMATGMLGISIPLSAVTQTAFIPVVVIAGAAVATLGVWWRPGVKSESSSGQKEQVAAQKRIAELEERLANLETINNFERRLAEEALARDAKVSMGEVMKDEQQEVTTAPESKARRVAM